MFFSFWRGASQRLFTGLCKPVQLEHLFFDNDTKSNGALAQLGERHAGSVEVSGSIPLGSTTS